MPLANWYSDVMLAVTKQTGIQIYIQTPKTTNKRKEGLK
jgi:hypothetical protein